MHILIESNQRLWFGPGAIASLAIHAALVGAIVTAYRTAPDPEPLTQRLVTYLVPPDRPEGATGLPLDQAWQAPAAREGTPLATRSKTEPEEGLGPTAEAQGDSVDSEVDVVALMAGETVLTEIQVDSAVRRDPSSSAPAYPPALLRESIEGSAFVVYVVDSTGLVDLTSYHVVRATHPEFAAAVREALPGMRFRPALLGGRPVRQLVEQPFVFKIRPNDSTRTRPPAS